MTYEPKTPLERVALQDLKRLYGMDWYFIPEAVTEDFVKARVKQMIKTGDF